MSVHLRDLAVREFAAVHQTIAIVVVDGVGAVSADLVHCLEGFVSLDNDFAVNPAAAVPTDEVWCFRVKLRCLVDAAIQHQMSRMILQFEIIEAIYVVLYQFVRLVVVNGGWVLKLLKPGEHLHCISKI